MLSLVVFISPKHSILSYFQLVSKKTNFNVTVLKKDKFRFIFTKIPFVSIYPLKQISYS